MEFNKVFTILVPTGMVLIFKQKLFSTRNSFPTLNQHGVCRICMWRFTVDMRDSRVLNFTLVLVVMD